MEDKGDLKTPGIQDLYKSRNSNEFCADLKDFVAGRSYEEQQKLLENDEFVNITLAAIGNADQNKKEVIKRVYAVFDEKLQEDIEDLFDL